MRIAIEIDERGELVCVCTDADAQVFIVNRHCPGDRVYLLTPGRGSHKIGVHRVQESLGGAFVGHADDGTLRQEGMITSPKLPPSKPILKAVS